MADNIYTSPEDVVAYLEKLIDMEKQNGRNIYRVSGNRLGGKDFGEAITTGFVASSGSYVNIVWSYKNILGVRTMMCRGAEMVRAIRHAAGHALVRTDQEAIDLLPPATHEIPD